MKAKPTKKTAKKTAAKKTVRNKGNAGKGRKKGSVNKITATVKDAIAVALACPVEGEEGKDGSVEFFKRLKQDDPRTFANIAAKLIPVQVEVDATIDNHVTFKLVQ